MKNCLLFCFLVLVVFVYKINAQISNSGFEDWDVNGNPIGWKATNAQPSYTTITKSNDSHSGNWAAEGNVVQFSVFTIGPSLISGEQSQGIPVNFRPGAIKGYYKFTSVQGDFLQVQANFKKNGVYIGGGTNNLTPAGSYTLFSIDIGFLTPDVPDSVLIAIFISGSSGLPHVGSKMFIDDLAWGSATDVNDINISNPFQFSLEQNYPNPFNPSTIIRYQLVSNSHVSLKVYDMLGNEVAELVNEEKPVGIYETVFDAQGFSSGIYFYKLQTNNFTEARKMILMR